MLCSFSTGEPAPASSYSREVSSKRSEIELLKLRVEKLRLEVELKKLTSKKSKDSVKKTTKPKVVESEVTDEVEVIESE